MNLKSIVSGLVIAMAVSATAVAQESAVKFKVLPLEGEGIPTNVVSTIQRKLVSAFDRSKASTENVYNVFAVKVQYDITESSETEGMVREVATVGVDMTLSAVNIIDHEIYYTTTIPLSGSASGGTEAALKQLANSIKVNDPVYVRFIRNARNRIADYYAENCAIVVEKARRLVQLQEYEVAACYLSAITPEVSCYDDASTLFSEIVPFITEPTVTEPDTVVIERVIEVPTQPDTVVVDRVVEVPAKPDTVIIDRVVEVPVRQQPQPKAPVVPKNEAPEIVIDNNNFDFKIVSCTGDLTRQSIVIEVLIKNRDKKFTEGWTWTNFYTAIDDNGNSLDDRCYRDGKGTYNLRLPYNVELRTYYAINNIREKFSKLSYTEFRFQGIKVKVSNLKVNWK